MEKNKGRKNILKSSLAVLLIIAGLVSFAGCAKKHTVTLGDMVAHILLQSVSCYA